MDQALALYYTIGFSLERYEINSASTIIKSYDELANLNRKENTLALGIYDPQQHYFIWNVSRTIQEKHAKEVTRLSRILDVRYQLYILQKEEAQHKK
ncbi:hypothetical protein WBJ53_28820 [Spirosoma sp. SC4-14]|uniref:hypothetical protein n=1 Tax=Spirosoma sp. SC4-14 TaxID=3128900 RepID=UPI0030CB7AC0